MEKYKIEITHGKYLGTKEAVLLQEKKILWFTFRIRKDFHRTLGCKIIYQVKAWKDLYNVAEIIDLT